MIKCSAVERTTYNRTHMGLRLNASHYDRTHSDLRSSAPLAIERTLDLAVHFILLINRPCVYFIFLMFGRRLWGQKPYILHYIALINCPLFILCFILLLSCLSFSWEAKSSTKVEDKASPFIYFHVVMLSLMLILSFNFLYTHFSLV